MSPDRPSTDRPIRVAVVNDFEVVVRGLAAMLDRHPDIDVVAATTGRDAPPVDVALYDTFGAADPGLIDVRHLVDDPSIAHVAIYTARFTEGAVTRALELGASGCLSKALDAAGLADALRRIAGGEKVVSSGLDHLDGRSARWPGSEFGLSAKESDVLALVVRGLDNKRIAEALYISPDTLKSRIRKLYRNIGATNRVEAVLWGIDHGFRAEADQSKTTED